MKFFIVFSLCIIVTYILQAVSYIRRIAEALEDLVYNDDDEDNVEESEVENEKGV